MSELLTKCREVYELLIQEHRALHREYRNQQLTNPRKFSINDIVFTNVQVQSKASTNTVKKLAYVRRGPYKITAVHPSGSYSLQLQGSHSDTTIKKHGSDLYLCPKQLIPHPPLQSSDQAYSELHCKTIDNPYTKAHIDGYSPATPWAAPAAFIQTLTCEVTKFPTVKELDEEIDFKDESTPAPPSRNSDTEPTTNNAKKEQPDHLLTLRSTTAANTKITGQTFSTIIRDIVISQGKMFFIAYHLPDEDR